MEIGLSVPNAQVSGRPAPRRAILLAAALGIATATCPSLRAQRAGGVAPSDWPPELGAALETYRSDAFVETQRVCRAIISEARNERLRREAAALHALAVMRTPARQDRLSGRAQLAELAQEDPALAERPECRLAVGIAETALNETAAAVRDLTAAVEGFAARQQYVRWAEACVALAEAWSKHNEWEAPLGRSDVPQPRNATEAAAIRRTQIKKLHQQVTEQPGLEEAAARIELILAENLIDAGDRINEGVTILERLAGVARVTPPIAQACLKLGRHYEQQQRWAEALRLYRQVEAASLGDISQRAAQLAKALARPQIVVDAPAGVPPGQPVQVDLRVRNLDAVQFELRRVDLWKWLESRQGRFAEALLPTTGSVALAREMETRAEQPHTWWNSTALTSPLRVTLAPGAYVALAQAEDREGRPLTIKRLVLVSDLRAVTIIGEHHALIWATPIGTYTHDRTDSLSAGFWMRGSFVPVRPEFDGEAARLRLPPEARLLRDKRWVCLVRAGEHVALCRGTLPRSVSADRGQPGVALLGSPSNPAPGETLHLFGWVVSDRGQSSFPTPEQTWQLDLLDTYEQRRKSVAVDVAPTGTFQVELPITDEFAGEHLSVVVRRGEQVLENVRGRFRVHVAPLDRPRFEVRCRLPTHVPPDTTELSGEIRAVYPWGVPLAGAKVSYTARAVRLPTADVQAAPVASLPFSGHGRLDDDGLLSFTVPISAFELGDGPLAIGLWAHVMSWDNRQVTAVAETLLGKQNVQLWLEHQPQSPEVHDPVRFGLAWFDPDGRATTERPTLEIRQADLPIARLRLYPSPHGLESEPWRPAAAGEYQALATLPLDTGEPATVRRNLRVRPGPATTEAATDPVTCRARYARRGETRGVRVNLSGRVQKPLLVMVEARDPLAAANVKHLDEKLELFLPLSENRPADAQVVIAAPSAAGLSILATAPVNPTEEDALELTLRAEPHAVAPGAILPVDVICPRGTKSPQEIVLLARLIDAATTGYVDWIPAPSAGGARAELSGLTVAPSPIGPRAADDDTTSAVPAPRLALAPDLSAALFEGVTLWADSRPIEGDLTRLLVPLPVQPGRYRLIVTARSAGGWTASAALALDAREGLRLSVELPETYTVGDRSVLAITVANPQAVSAAARLEMRPGAGLHVESLRVIDTDEVGNVALEQNGATLELPPGDQVRLLARIEATDEGPATATINLQTGAIWQQVQRSYRVFPLQTNAGAESGDAPPPIRIKRTLHWLLTEAEFAPPPDGQVRARTSFPEWTAMTPVQPGERLAPGQWLLIRDEFVLDEALTDVTWTQRLPAASVSPASEPDGFQHVGRWQDAGLHRVVYTAARLSAGRQLHECPVVLVRPGTYRLPPPEIRVRGRMVAVEIEPTELHVLVSDPASEGVPAAP